MMTGTTSDGSTEEEPATDARLSSGVSAAHARLSSGVSAGRARLSSGVSATESPDQRTSNPPLILRLDVTGQPVRWIPWRTAAVLDTRSMIAWNAGEHQFTFYGGTNRASGLQSSVTVNSIIAIKGRLKEGDPDSLVPPLSNRELFSRDGRMCMYCGKHAGDAMLTRDHVRPLSQDGEDTWKNVVTACMPCNHAKGARTPEQANMTLLAVPYVPNRAEYLVLSNRRILADQMEFLRKRFRKNSRLQI